MRKRFWQTNFPIFVSNREKRLGIFYEHKAPGFSVLAREFYANMVGMKDDSVYVRGVWVPFGDRRKMKCLN